MRLFHLSFFLTVFISILGFGQSSSIIVSPIGDQEVFEGARITVYFSTLKYFEEDVTMESENLPGFGTLINDGHGAGRIIFDATEGDAGQYLIDLVIRSGALYHRSEFLLNVRKIPEGASVYYVDPVTGSNDNPGTASQPFKTLTLLLNTKINLFKDNTFFFLRSGYHGVPVFQGTYQNPIYVLAEKGNTPGVKRMNFSFTTGWYVSGLSVSPQVNGQLDNTTLINVFAGSRNIILTNCYIYSIEDSGGWTSNNDWYNYCGNGILCSGKQCVFKNNFFKNTWFTVEMRKPDVDFVYNVIDYFGADAIRALHNDQTIAYNQIKNATVFDYNDPNRPQHDDGIQSYTFSAPVKNVQIIGNQIVDIADPHITLPTEIMQGIVDFDGFAEDWRIENNLVITHHAHGIALYGAKNCKVVNNSVIRNPFNLFSQTFKPWIRINPRKQDAGGERSFGNLVRNNIMATYQDEGKDQATVDHNRVGSDYQNIYKDYAGWDFHLAQSEATIDAGWSEDAPTRDIEGNIRPEDTPDLGCFEYDGVPGMIGYGDWPCDVTIDDVTNRSIKISWPPAISDNGIAYYEVYTNEKPEKTIDTGYLATGLIPGTLNDLRVIAIDKLGRKVANGCGISVTLPESQFSEEIVLRPTYKDQLVKSNERLPWVGMPYHRIGGYFGQQDAVAVLPLELPVIPDGYTITDVDFSVVLDAIVGNPDYLIDLYLIDKRQKEDVMEEDFWQGDYGTDALSVPIQKAFLGTIASGVISLSAAAKEKLKEQLMSFYENGNPAGEYIFLRMNADKDNCQNNTYYSVISSDHLDVGLHPEMRITIQKTSGEDTPLNESEPVVFPNPANEKVFLEYHNKSTKPIYLTILDVMGRKIKSMEIPSASTPIKIVDYGALTPGLYYVKIAIDERIITKKMIIQK